MLKRNKYYFIIGITFIALAILFLWKESFDLNKRINDQKIQNFFVAVFTAIGTISAIVYSVKQHKLAELVNQTAIKPDLYPKSFFFQMEDDEEPLDIKGIPKNLYLTHAFSLKSGHKLMIENIGVGVAKNLMIKWIFNVEEVEKLIKGVYYLSPKTTQKDIPYLNPHAKEEIPLPDEYLSCCGPRLFKKFPDKYISNKSDSILDSIVKPKGSEVWFENKFPKKRPQLQLEVIYTDVQDFKYTKIFDVEVSGVRNLLTFNFK